MPEFFDGLDLETLLKGFWIAVPVPLVLENGCIRYFLCGTVPASSYSPLPEWCSTLLSVKAGRAVKVCADFARDYILKEMDAADDFSLMSLPLLLQGPRAPIQGSSMGLPLALGFCLAARRTKWPKKLVATGILSADGRLDAAGSIRQKASCAQEEGFSGIICPGEIQNQVKRDGIIFLRVEQFDEALSMIERSHARSPAELLVQDIMEKDIGCFVSNIENVDPEAVIAAAGIHKNRRISFTRPMEVFDRLKDSLKACFEKRKLEHAAAIAGLVEPEDLAELAGISPLKAFKWHTYAMAVYNNLGRASEAEKHADMAICLLEEASEISPETRVYFSNLFFIGKHNRYEFEPEIRAPIKKSVSYLKECFRVQRKAGVKVYPPLGAIFGSIAQNYGFCGPAYTGKVKGYSIVAMEAFGSRRYQDFAEDAERPLNYIFYSMCDAEREKEAESYLLAYTGRESLKDIADNPEGLNEWKHAAVARFFVEKKEDENAVSYLNRTLTGIDWRRKNRHPWQLWLKNMGIVALQNGFVREAEALLKKSLQICLSPVFGPTVTVMALMPAAVLNAMGKLDHNRLCRLEKDIKEAAFRLNRRYFQLLEKAKFEDVLELTRIKPETFFLFTYR